MGNKFLFVIILAVFVISSSCIAADSVPYHGTINFNSGSTSIGVNVTGPGISINVTNTTGGTTTGGGTTTTAGGGGGAAATTDTFVANNTENLSSGNNNAGTGNLGTAFPLNGINSSEPNQGVSSSSSGIAGITGNLVKALGSAGGLSITGILVLAAGIAVFIFARNKSRTGRKGKRKKKK